MRFEVDACRVFYCTLSERRLVADSCVLGRQFFFSLKKNGYLYYRGSSACPPRQRPNFDVGSEVAAVELAAAGMVRNRTEQLLVGLIAVLTLWGIIMQVMVRSYVRQERSLTSGDEERLAEEIASIENELVQQFTPQQLDVWAAEADETDERGARGVADADPNVPNANGEFTVSQTQLAHSASGPDVLLASRLLFPVVDGDWCELKMTRAIAPGSYQLAMTGVLGRWGAQAAAGLLILQVRMAGDWSPLLGAPRARSEDSEAPLRHNFSVSHRFDGIRVLATTWRTFNSG